MGPKEPPVPPSQPPTVEINQDSFSLDPKQTLFRGASWMKLRFINYLTRPENPPEVQGSRFGSCNEFTLGINQNNENIEISESVGTKQNSETPNP